MKGEFYALVQEWKAELINEFHEASAEYAIERHQRGNLAISPPIYPTFTFDGFIAWLGRPTPAVSKTVAKVATRKGGDGKR